MTDFETTCPVCEDNDELRDICDHCCGKGYIISIDFF